MTQVQRRDLRDDFLVRTLARACNSAVAHPATEPAPAAGGVETGAHELAR